MVLLWVCSVPSLPVCLPVHGIHYMSTSGYSSHTPEIELIKWAWLDILHTTDVFDVVFGSIPCFHPRTQRANQGSALTGIQMSIIRISHSCM